LRPTSLDRRESLTETVVSRDRSVIIQDMFADRRTAILLGAGASRDAGLPLTSDLAAAVLRSLEGTTDPHASRPDWLIALNFVYGAMVSYRSRNGANALDAVNIETLISALRLLGRREDHEAAPFVEGWRDPVFRSGQLLVDERSADRLLDALDKATAQETHRFSGIRRNRRSEGITLGYAVAEIADLARNPTRLSSYIRADDQVIRALGSLLKPTQPVSYLYPIAHLARRQTDGLDVITLNYDLTVEAAMVQQSVAVDRGVQDWPHRRVAYASDSVLRLHKVHGSLDWEIKHDPQRGVLALEDLGGQVAERPWIVVGDREKLATEGPTLELMQQAADALERADHLVVSGYGFADAHVNHIIRNWLERDSSRSLAIIEPHWVYPGGQSFRGSLSRLYGEQRDQASRIQGFEGTTAQYLEAALMLPGVDVTQEPSVEVVEQVGDGWQLDVTLRLGGGPLRRVWFAADRARCTLHADGEVTRIENGRIQYLEKWDVGEVIRVSVGSNELPRSGWNLDMEGHGLVSTIRRSVPLREISNPDR